MTDHHKCTSTSPVHAHGIAFTNTQRLGRSGHRLKDNTKKWVTRILLIWTSAWNLFQRRGSWRVLTGTQTHARTSTSLRAAVGSASTRCPSRRARGTSSEHCGNNCLFSSEVHGNNIVTLRLKALRLAYTSTLKCHHIHVLTTLSVLCLGQQTLLPAVVSQMYGFMDILQGLEALVLLLCMYDRMRIEKLMLSVSVLHGSIITPLWPYTCTMSEFTSDEVSCT